MSFDKVLRLLRLDVSVTRTLSAVYAPCEVRVRDVKHLAGVGMMAQSKAHLDGPG